MGERPSCVFVQRRRGTAGTGQRLKCELPTGLMRAMEERGWGVMLGGTLSCSKAAASHTAGKAKATKVEGENEISCQLMLLECWPAG